MNKRLLLSTAAASLLAAALMTGPALADVTVVATIDKTKTVHVFESITIFKRVDIAVFADYTLNGAAEADAIKNILNEDNVVTGQAVDPLAEVEDFQLRAFATIDGSINDGFGVTGVNQSSGNMANQGNVVSVAAIADDPLAFADAQAEADEVNRNNTVTDHENLDFDPFAGDPVVYRKSAEIIDSINGNHGIVDVNQEAGNMNNQDNADAIAVAFGGVLALSEAALGQVNTGNTVDEIGTVRVGRISGSINSNSGIVKVNQATGNMNNQANNVAFAALTVEAAITTPTNF